MTGGTSLASIVGLLAGGVIFSVLGGTIFGVAGGIALGAAVLALHSRAFGKTSPQIA